MARRSNNSRIYGLTLKQWTTLALIVVAIVVSGCGFCYSLIRKPAPNENTNQTANGNRGRKPRQSSAPASQLSIQEATARYLKFGNPSNAAATDANNFLMVNPTYALSYNRLRGTANWVAWTLTEGDLGAVDRANDFRPDSALPNGFYRVTPNDYTNSGYDRGHFCPSADRTTTPESNSQTFLMTNIAPQTPDLNREVWGNLENDSRALVRQGNDLYVIAGLYGEERKLKNKVVVPTNYWKVILILPDGIENAANIGSDARVIAVDMPNRNGIKGENWRKYRTTVRRIEEKTGLNFFSNLPANIQDVLKSKQDAG